MVSMFSHSPQDDDILHKMRRQKSHDRESDETQTGSFPAVHRKVKSSPIN